MKSGLAVLFLVMSGISQEPNWFIDLAGLPGEFENILSPDSPTREGFKRCFGDTNISELLDLSEGQLSTLQRHLVPLEKVKADELQGNLPEVRQARSKFHAQVQRVLFTSQLRKLRQISIQLDEGWALRDSSVREKIGMSEAQSERFQILMSNCLQEINRRLGSLDVTSEAVFVKHTAHAINYYGNELLKQSLTKEQQKRFRELTADLTNDQSKGADKAP